MAADHCARLLGRRWASRPNRLTSDGLVPALDLAVGLRVVRRGPHVCHAGDADELLEVLGDELGSVVGDDTRPGLGMELAGALQDALNIGFRHTFVQFPVHDGSAGAIQHRTQGVECAAEIEVGDVDMSVLMRPERLEQASALLGGAFVPARQQTRRG